MKILHVVPGLNENGNGIAVAAKLIAQEQAKSGAEVEVVDTKEFISTSSTPTFDLHLVDEVLVHSMWLPQTMRACWKVLRAKKLNHDSPPPPNISTSSPSLVRMTHANLDPVRLAYHGWKKRLVGPIERWIFSKADRVVVTCAAEKAWCERWGLKNEFEVVDLKRFFVLERKSLRDAQDLSFSDLATTPTPSATPESQNAKVVPRGLHVLYLGRRHPLKGVGFLERAVQEINDEVRMTNDEWRKIEFRIVSDHFGEELERDWAWCDVLCLPTLSENFGLVVAEALERGKRVVVTDGAPAWDVEVEKVGGGGQWRDRLFYVRGFRDGTDEERVKLLKEALHELRVV